MPAMFVTRENCGGSRILSTVRREQRPGEGDFCGRTALHIACGGEHVRFSWMGLVGMGLPRRRVVRASRGRALPPRRRERGVDVALEGLEARRAEHGGERAGRRRGLDGGGVGLDLGVVLDDVPEVVGRLLHRREALAVLAPRLAQAQRVAEEAAELGRLVALEVLVAHAQEARAGARARRGDGRLEVDAPLELLDEQGLDVVDAEDRRGVAAVRLLAPRADVRLPAADAEHALPDDGHDGLGQVAALPGDDAARGAADAAPVDARRVLRRDREAAGAAAVAPREPLDHLVLTLLRAHVRTLLRREELLLDNDAPLRLELVGPPRAPRRRELQTEHARAVLTAARVFEVPSYLTGRGVAAIRRFVFASTGAWERE
mmetsp:Transcript_15019/g.44852  ORF Transcript_15019/g.44852 Transcript_15019/m.44852 type:complete len:375 (-) Transcript_15019:120-1244(-)